MSAVTGQRPDSINELVRILREQADVDAQRISNLQKELIEARQRIIDQQRLLARLLERGGGGSASPPLPPQLSYPMEVRARPVSPPLQTVSEPRIIRADRTIPPEESSVFEEVKAAVTSSPSNALPVVSENPEPPRAQLPPIQIPQIGVVASTVLNAVVVRQNQEYIEQPSEPEQPLAIHLPTSGNVRATAEEWTADSESVETSERTLKIDRRALRKGHEAMAGETGRPRWLKLRR